MRYLITLFLTLTLFADSYNFDEYKFVFAASLEFHKSGKISFDGNKTVITYDKPQYKQIITDGQSVTIEGSSGNIYKLKGKALFYTKQFIELMKRLGNFSEIKTNRDFDVKKDKNRYILTFISEIQDQILKAEVITKNSKVKSFKLFLKNNDTLEIAKR